MASETLADFARRGEISISTGPFGSALHAHDYQPTGIAVVPTEAISPRGLLHDRLVRISREKARELERHKLQDGDIVFARRGVQACGISTRVSAADGEAIAGTGVITLRILARDRIDQRFLACTVGSDDSVKWLKHHAIGATMPNLNSSVILSLPITLPSIAEQRAIAHILGTLDDKIELNRRANETLEAMARALFKAWFVDFEPVRAKLEGRWQHGQSLPGLPAHLYDLFPDRLVESELVEIPEGWEYVPLSRFIEIFDSRRVPLSSKQRAERQGIYPYHGATGVMDTVDDYLFDGIHVLLGEDGSVVQENGRPYTQYVWGKFWVNNHAHVLRGRGMTNETLLLFLEQCDVAPFVTGAVQPKLSQGNLKAIPFLSPGDALLSNFGQIVAAIFEQTRDLSEESRSLIQLRDTLLPKLISGELRIKDAEAFLKERVL